MAAQEEEWWAPPQTEDGLVDMIQLTRDLCHHVHCVGGYLTDCASTLMELNVELPPRGVLRDLYTELVERIAICDERWRYADDALLTSAQLLEIECRR